MSAAPPKLMPNRTDTSMSRNGTVDSVARRSGLPGLLDFCQARLKALMGRSRSNVEEFRRLLERVSGVDVVVRETLEIAVAYVVINDGAQRAEVTRAQAEIVKHHGSSDFELVVLYPDDLLYPSVQALLSS